DRVQRAAVVRAGRERAPLQAGQSVEGIVSTVVVPRAAAVGVVQLGERAIHQVVLGQDVAVPVVGVLEAVGGGAGAAAVPILVHDPAEAVQPHVLVTPVRVGVRVAVLLGLDQGGA